MATWNDLLIRDSQQDTGTVPSPGYPYTSPDIICTQQNTYSNPNQQFGSSESYGVDPNLAVIAQQNNYFYIRAKNLGAQAQSGQAYVYWTKASLLMTPNLWFNQPLKVNIGGNWQANNPLPSAATGAISVCQAPYAWTPPPISGNDHFCLVGAVGTSLHAWPPAQPPSFANADAFALWVRNNQNICWRNLSLITNPAVPQWDRVDSLANPWSDDRPLLVSATCTNLPIGTNVTLKCTALGINTTQAITNSTKQVVYGQGVTIPAGFNGYVETLAVLPNGSRWPSGALINTTAYIGTVSRSAIAAFAHDFGEDTRHPHVAKALALAGDGNDGRLVAIGNCTTTYTGS